MRKRKEEAKVRFKGENDQASGFTEKIEAPGKKGVYSLKLQKQAVQDLKEALVNGDDGAGAELENAVSDNTEALELGNSVAEPALSSVEKEDASPPVFLKRTSVQFQSSANEEEVVGNNVAAFKEEDMFLENKN